MHVKFLNLSMWGLRRMVATIKHGKKTNYLIMATKLEGLILAVNIKYTCTCDRLTHAQNHV
jgi:hypothetical protein